MKEDETETLKKYWERVRLQWEASAHEKDFGYITYSKNLLAALDGVKTSLEIGFGDGRWIKFLSEKGIHAYGIDILENAAFTLKKEEFSPVIADARQLPFKKDSFDLTYSFGVVEHFTETEKALKEHVQITRPGGKIVVTVPYLFSPYTVYWMFIHVKRDTFKERPATFGKRYTRKGFKTILEKFDVEITKINPFMFPIPGFRNIYHENPLLNRVGLMLWAEMIKV